MKNIVCLIVCLLCISCSTVKQVPIANTENIQRVDSTIIQYRDTTIYVEVPVEVIKEVVPQLDTLFMETSLAKSTSYLDTTTQTLKGTLANKTEPIEKIVYLPSKEHIVYRDSIVTKEIPVEVIVEKPYTPNWCWYSLIINVICGMLIGFKIYRKFSII